MRKAEEARRIKARRDKRGKQKKPQAGEAEEALCAQQFELASRLGRRYHLSAYASRQDRQCAIPSRHYRMQPEMPQPSPPPAGDRLQVVMIKRDSPQGMIRPCANSSRKFAY